MLLGINIKFVLLDIILAGFIKLLRIFKRGDNSLKTQASFNSYWSNHIKGKLNAKIGYKIFCKATIFPSEYQLQR